MRLPNFELETIIKHIQEHGFESLDPTSQTQADEVLQDHIARQRFERVAADSRYWRDSGDRLFAAANLIRVTHLTNWGLSVSDVLNGGFDAAAAKLKFNMHSVYLFLAGLSVENYAKGAIMKAAANNHVMDGMIKGLPSHDCLALTLRANVTLTVSEKETLKCLTTHIVWRGRYPTKKQYDKPDKPLSGAGSRIPEDYANIDEIVKKLLAVLNG